MGLFAKRTIPLGNHKRLRLLTQPEILEKLENAKKKGGWGYSQREQNPLGTVKNCVRGVAHTTGVSGKT